MPHPLFSRYKYDCFKAIFRERRRWVPLSTEKAQFFLDFRFSWEKKIHRLAHALRWRNLLSSFFADKSNFIPSFRSKKYTLFFLNKNLSYKPNSKTILNKPETI